MNQEKDIEILLGEGGRDITLEPKSKARMRHVIEARLSRLERKTRLHDFIFSHAYIVRGGTALLAVFVAVLSVSAAAEGSLPGDLLYNFKRTVNERALQGYFGITNNEIAFEKVVINRRIEEAQELLQAPEKNKKIIIALGDEIGTKLELFSTSATSEESEQVIKDSKNAILSIINISEPATPEYVRLATLVNVDAVASGSVLATKSSPSKLGTTSESESTTLSAVSVAAPIVPPVSSATYSLSLSTENLKRDGVIDITIIGRNTTDETLRLSHRDSCLISLEINSHVYRETGECEKKPFDITLKPNDEVVWKSPVKVGSLNAGSYIAVLKLGGFTEKRIPVIIKE